VRPSGGHHIVSIAFKGRPTHHKLALNEDGILAIGGRTLGLSTRKPMDVIARLTKAPLPKGWPVQLLEAATPNGTFVTSFLGGGGDSGDKKARGPAGKRKTDDIEAKPPTNNPGPSVAAARSHFVVGDTVHVDPYGEGTVRFVGVHHVSGSPRVGVELSDAVGNNNGTVKGHTYFECPQKHGVLVSPHKCTKISPPTKSEEIAPMDATPNGTTNEDLMPPLADTNGVTETGTPLFAMPQTVVSFKRTDLSQAFGFGIAEVYTGWAEKWATIVSEVSAENVTLEVGSMVVRLECELATEGTIIVDLTGGRSSQYAEAVAALHEAGNTVRITVVPPKPMPTRPPVTKRRWGSKRSQCGDTVWCRCPKCATAAAAAAAAVKSGAIASDAIVADEEMSEHFGI